MFKEFLVITTVCAVIIGCILLAGWPAMSNHMVVRYDCSIAEISPDFPTEVKEACRKRNKR